MLEPGTGLTGKLKTARKGVGDFHVVVKGRASHAGVDFDVAAILPIVEEAGGRMTDWEGNRTIHRPDVLASNGRLHDQGSRPVAMPAISLPDRRSR